MNLRQKPSGLWIVDYEAADGSRRRVSTGTRDKREATARAREIVLGINEPAKPGARVAPAGSPDGRPSGFTMDDLFSRCERTVWSPRECKSQATVRSNLKVLSPMIGKLLVSEVTAAKLETLRDDLFAMDYAAGTVKRKLDMVGKALTMATRWEGTDGRPILTGKPAMPQIKARNSRSRFLSDAEIDAVFQAVEKRRADEPHRNWRRMGILLRFLLDTGCRLGEALNCRAEFFETRTIPAPAGSEEEPRSVTFVTFPRYSTKNDKPRQLPLTAAIVGDLPYLRDNAHVDGRVFPVSAAHAWYMWTNIRDDLAELGLDLSDAVLHTFRHTCLTRLAKRLPIHKVSEWAGHSNIQVTIDHYAHLKSEDLLDGLAVLDA